MAHDTANANAIALRLCETAVWAILTNFSLLCQTPDTDCQSHSHRPTHSHSHFHLHFHFRSRLPASLPFRMVETPDLPLLS